MDYPYDYMDCQATLNAIQLPSKEDFYRKLSWEHISDDDYAHVQRVFETFE